MKVWEITCLKDVHYKDIFDKIDEIICTKFKNTGNYQIKIIKMHQNIYQNILMK